MPFARLFAFAVTFGAICALAPTAGAYIPQSQSIVGRVAHNHGKGGYIIEQEVQFRTSSDPLVLRERWLVENGERMRLSVSAPAASAAKPSEPIRYEALYHDGKRLLTDVAGGTVIKASPVSPEFIEGFFHDRTSKSFINALIRSRIVPPSFVHERPRVTKIEQIRHFPEPQVRLGRTAGVIAWIFGEPSPVEGKANPEAWIEQDSFVLRRLRFPSDAEIAADRISAYPNGLKFPRERTVTWDNNSVTIRVVSIKAAANAQLNKALEPNAFASASKPARLPDVAQVREFYSRFR